ncbi:MAG: HAD-IA family hydrolase, partial [Lachnospiraceae bacterium]|nr:HAD-IA family hydrolase [Lachnospiraceae bacterium]
KVILATNPLFPRTAVLSRMGWAGVKEEDFEHITTYENSTYAKPNPGYYTEILEKINANPEECLMVGNDAVEDTAAKKAGIDVFILTDCLINPNNEDINELPHGSFEDLGEFLNI